MTAPPVFGDVPWDSRSDEECPHERAEYDLFLAVGDIEINKLGFIRDEGTFLELKRDAQKLQAVIAEIEAMADRRDAA